MNKYGELIAPDTVRFARLLPGPIERVWAYLTESDKRARWFCAGDTELRVGGHMDMLFEHAKLSPISDEPRPEKYKDMPAKFSSEGAVTECDAPRRLTFTWHELDGHSEVSYELVEQDDSVLLILTHRRLESRDAVISVCGGWHTHLDILEEVMAGAQPQPFWSRHQGLELKYEKLIETAD